MTEAGTFHPVQLICGIISAKDGTFTSASERLEHAFGELDICSDFFPFVFTDYYEKQMGPGLKRRFLSFKTLIDPERLSDIKLETNALEEIMRRAAKSRKRLVNLDPGYLSASALVMATAKDFSHRIPLKNGIYAHLEFLFGKKDVKLLEWTYPDFRTPEYHEFFLCVRSRYLRRLREIEADRR